MAQLQRYCLTFAAVLAAAGLTGGLQPAQTAAVEVNLSDQFGSFRVVNTGPGISLKSEVEVERQVDGKWQNARVSNLLLVRSCQEKAAQKCIQLAARATLQPPPWRGTYCYSQCPISCDLDGPLPAGTYRFAITSCDGKHRFLSASFQKKE